MSLAATFTLVRSIRERAAKRLQELARDTAAAAVAGGRAILRNVRKGPLEIVPYRSFGTAQRVRVMGRVVERVKVPASRPTDAKWVNLVRLYHRVSTDGIPHAKVVARIPGIGGVTERILEADDEGFVHQWVDLDAPLDQRVLWHPIEMHIAEPESTAKAAVLGQVLVPPVDAEFGIISDLDDTVIQSHVDDFLQAIYAVALSNAHSRTPFPGVADFYRELAFGPDRAGHNPIFYVSSSPWELLDAIEEFLEIQGITAGPVLLRDWDLDRRALGGGALLGHKLPLIREILALYPSLPFVLIGDSTQRDPEIYRQIVHEHPDRVRAIYIRNVGASAERLAAIAALAEEVTHSSARLVVVADTAEAERDALEHGLIAER